jgi:translation initiation factor 2 alpha subunit (eIF-2alpha)
VAKQVSNWSGVMDESQVPEAGLVVDGVVEMVLPFGVFLRVDQFPDLQFLIRVVDLDPAGSPVFQDYMPSVGDRVSGVVLGVSANGQVIVSRRLDHYQVDPSTDCMG